MRDLEQSLLELHQIFLDMAVLVEVQGEMLDNIERQVRALETPAIFDWITPVACFLEISNNLIMTTHELQTCILFHLKHASCQ